MVAAKRIFGLDLLRCIAILLVLLTHTVLFLNPSLFKIAVCSGLLGVELFFVLSGFLIGSILLKIHFHQSPINLKSIKVFWMRRWFRTLPNYYLMFFVLAIVMYFSHHINVFTHLKYLSYLLFLQNSITPQPTNFFIMAWSLSIEEWFYLLFPLLILLLSFIFIKKTSLSFLFATLIFIMAGLAIRTYAALYLHNSWDDGIRKMMPMRLDSIAIGVLAAYVKFNQIDFWNNNAGIMAICGGVLFTIMIIYFSISYVKYFDPVTWDHLFKPGIFLDTLFFTLVSLSVALVIPYLCNLTVLKTFIIVPVTFISKISYSMYLLHFFVISIIVNIFKHFPHFNYLNVVMFISIWAATILFSAIQYNFFEVKMTSLRTRFSRAQETIKI